MYDVILCDPPWFYNNRKTGGERKDKTKFGGGCRKHYPVMTDQELLDMDKWVALHSNENSAMFMWVTRPRQDFAMELLKAWGFRYTTEVFTWVKLSEKTRKPIFGPGYYTASNTEGVILGVKGSMPPVKKMMPSLIFAPRREHSRKPDLHKRIEAMYPDGKYLEMFARRTPHDNWSYWGNEIGDER